MVRFAGFALENWLSRWEHRAERVIAWSGVQSAPLAALGAPALPDVLDYGEIPGEPALERAIAQWQGVPRENVLVTVGGTEADFLVPLALVAPGDVALVEAPTYFPLAEVPRLLGATVERIERRFEDEFRLDADAVARRVRRGDVRLVSLTNPNNPTGQIVPPRDLVTIAEACADADAWLMVDEIFRDLAFDAQPCAATLHPRIVATGSLTKCYGLSGLRCGWALATAEVRAMLREGKALTTIANPIVDQHLALAAIARRDALLDRARAIAGENFARLRKFVADRDDLDWVEPRAAPLSAPRLLPAGSDDVAFAEALLEAESTLVAPGSFLDLPGHVRVGFGVEPRAFEDGLARLARFMDARRARAT